MQLQQPEDFGQIGTIGNVTSNPPSSPPASMDPPDYLSPIREEALRLLKSDREPVHVACLIAGALVTGFGLGWASGLSWYSPPAAVALDRTVQRDSSSRRPEIRSVNKIENVRKQTPLGAGAYNFPKAQVASSEARADGASLRTASLPATIGQPGTPIGTREPIVAAPETRPTTIEGWTVLDVRGGTAVLEGPDGIRMATTGDTVPGIGRIDSIVRWGNRWIVATAGGLIATP